MKKETDWLKILTSCKNRALREIRPILKTLGKQQIDLGIGAGGDPIRQIDLTAEEAILDTLQKQQQNFTLISEESGTIEHGQQPHRHYVTIDPIDGTTNLTRGAPFYATSMAVSSEPWLSKVHTSLVGDLVHGATYTAKKGSGAYRDGQSITPSRNTSLEDGVIGIDLNSYRTRHLADILTNLMSNAKHIRHFGANALELCYVADGTIDAFVDLRGKLRTTDIAGAWLVMEEAGAIITTAGAEPLDAKLDPKQKVEFIASANSGIHGKILESIHARKGKKC